MKEEGNKKAPIPIQKKAELIHYGRIYVPDTIELPYALSSSTAGPGAGGKALALVFGETRLKLGVTGDENAAFSLVKKDTSYMIMKGEDVFVGEVNIIPTLLHAPNQAFVNLYDDCIYHCAFCPTPVLDDDKRKNRGITQAVQMIIEAAQNPDFQSVAITSGVLGSPGKTLDDMISVVEKVRLKLPDVDIGVEPYVADKEDLHRLHDAGATEIKINIESFDNEIFERICPDLDYELILDMLDEAVGIFGRGRVATNIIIGIGESDENVLEGIEHFASMGVVPGLRVLRLNEFNKERITHALGHDVEKVSQERMLRLAHAQKEILEKHELSTQSFKTMCHECGCCDIVPGRDV
jgi:biotin synthase-related radical SAM superfamily protein